MKKIAPILPGEILEEDFLKPLGITAYRLAIERELLEKQLRKIYTLKRGPA